MRGSCVRFENISPLYVSNTTWAWVYNDVTMQKVVQRTLCFVCLLLLAAGSIIESIDTDSGADLSGIYLGGSGDVILLQTDKATDPDAGDELPEGEAEGKAEGKAEGEAGGEVGGKAKSDKADSPKVKSEKPKASSNSKKDSKSAVAPKNKAAAGTGRSTGSGVAGGIPSLAAGQDIAIIRIEGVIDGYTLLRLRHRTELAKALGVTVIVLELDTPGGRLDSSLKISRFVKKLNPDFQTIAWVHDEAYSAGSLIAAACNHIIMSSRSTIGDTAPIRPGQNLAPTTQRPHTR